MATLPQTAPTCNPVAFYAALAGVPGVALRTPERTVLFRADATATWHQLTNAEAPRLTLYGRCDLADTQALTDGDKVYRCSKTLQARRAA
jgi:hypothetical protein